MRFDIYTYRFVITLAYMCDLSLSNWDMVGAHGAIKMHKKHMSFCYFEG